MNYSRLFIFLGGALVGLGVMERGVWLLAGWLGFNFLLLGLAHHWRKPDLFGKRNGSLPLWSWLLFFPLLGYTAWIWHLLRLASRKPAFNRVSGKLVVGRRLLLGEVSGPFDNFVDLTAEFVEPVAIRKLPSYIGFPILDGGAPSPEVLFAALARLKPGRTYVHCAQGHGRTGLFALAMLLHSGEAANVAEGLRMLQAARLAIHLNQEQVICLQAFAARLRLGEVPK